MIGCGVRGSQWAGQVKANPSWELAGIVDPDDAARSRAAETLDIAPASVFSSADEAADRIGRSLDAVIVATPAYDHVDPIRWALKKGFAVLVEKPFTTSFSEAAALVQEADEAKIPLMVAQNYRYLRMNRALKEVLEAEKLGRVGLIIGHYYGPQGLPESLLNLPHSALWGLGVHHLDALMFLFGKPIRRIMARSETAPWNDRPPGATLSVMAEMRDGPAIQYSATYETSGHQFFEGGQEFYERIVGDKATLHVFYRWLFICKGKSLPRPVRRGKREQTEEAILLAQLAEAVTNGTEPECSGRQNLQTMAVMEACLRSASEQRWVDLEEIWDATD